MFTPNWSLKAENFNYDLGTVTHNFVIAALNPRPTPGIALFGSGVRGSVNRNIVGAGVNYHLIWALLRSSRATNSHYGSTRQGHTP